MSVLTYGCGSWKGRGRKSCEKIMSGVGGRVVVTSIS